MEMLRGLLSGSRTPEFKTAVAKQILKATSSSSSSSSSRTTELLHSIVPALVQTIRAPDATNSGSNLSLLHLCTASLVNLSAGDPRTKEILLEGGIHNACVALLKCKEQTITLSVVLLLLNLTKLAAHRQQFLAAGGLYPIVDLLMHNYASDLAERRPLLSGLMGVVGQLANDETAHAEMILFAIKQLCRGRWQLQHRVSVHLVKSLAAALFEFDNVEFVAAALSLLQTLTNYKPNCFDMKAAGIQEALLSVLRRTKLDTLYHRVANLQERINAQTKYDYFSV
ncbi:hypothetical protein ETH_00025615 [Eimeria tenella]|uniref:Armadillo/beta-catenin-like repeat-containing protein n=1 Tax=Eimeria tenella TaxID=5802 RepID=U6KRF1_EIMTE|nr:hypothetical protein ETH_00025615 [Eimeria tenella]CDJ38018.1 hypothetical protein ETH_00025615 [Eimeria tenella]|eukprot:XP_013228856.1 hypothetical protein ETH_00025615 [Eimeria tenella]